VPNTEAIRLGLEFEDGKVKGFIFRADTLKITLGSVLTLNATDIAINTSAAASEEMVSFRSVGAEVTIGSLVLGGEGRNFAFLGDGTFVTKPGFGVFISVGSATGASFKWPAWLPIKITEIGITWPDIQNDPERLRAYLVGRVTGLQGVSGLKFSGAIEGSRSTWASCWQRRVPDHRHRRHRRFGQGNLFGGQIKAGLIGGIIKLDANRRAMIDSFDTTTPVKARIFFIGIEGGFSFSGVGGFGIKFALSELGPLGVYLFASIPGGIILEPNTGLAINDFSAGVEFFKSLPSIDKPEELRGPDFGLPTAVSADQWLAGVKQQVVKQYRAIQANPVPERFFAAFTSPMLITGGAKVFTIYASQAGIQWRGHPAHRHRRQDPDHRQAQLRGGQPEHQWPPVCRPVQDRRPARRRCSSSPTSRTRCSCCPSTAASRWASAIRTPAKRPSSPWSIRRPASPTPG
jgi:hypothetical protein